MRGSVRKTMQTTGHALLTTSTVLALGFRTYAFCEMRNLVEVAYITTLAIPLAFAADFLVAPALVSLLTRSMPHAMQSSKP